MENISVLNVIGKDFSKNFLWMSETLGIEISVGFNSNAKKDVRFQNKYIKIQFFYVMKIASICI